MSDLRHAAQQALEALEGVLDTYGEPLDKLSIAGGTYEALYCRDAITALRAALAEPEPFQPDWDRVEALQESLREHMEQIRQLRAALAAAVAEPVAWQYREANADGTWSAWVGCDKPLAADAWRQVRALYAAPAAPPQREREPLTDAQIEDCIDASNRAFNIYRSSGPIGQQITTMDDWKYWLARAIERAHGISAPKEQA